MEADKGDRNRGQREAGQGDSGLSAAPEMSVSKVG